MDRPRDPQGSGRLAPNLRRHPRRRSTAHRTRARGRRPRSSEGPSGRAFLPLALLRLLERYEGGVHLASDDLAVDHALGHVAARGQLVHRVQQDLFHDRAEAPRTGGPQDRLVGDRVERVVGELELDAVELEELAVLLHQRVLRLGEDVDERLLVQVVDVGDHRKSADELRDQPVLEQVLGEHLAEDRTQVLLLDAPHVGAEPDPARADPALDDLLEPRERAAADEQDVRRVDLDELLVRVLAAALRRDAGGGALQDLQERLLHALAGHVARDRRVLGLACDLVDLVDVDDPGLGLLHVVVGRLDQLQQDVLDVLAYVACLGERRRVRDRERNVQHLREGLREERLAAPGRPQDHDVRLLELNLRVLGPDLDPLVVVVDVYRKDLLGVVLADHVFLEERVDLLRLGELFELELGGLGQLLLDDLVAEIDALVADVHAGARDELLDLLLRLPAEGALQKVGVADPRHAPGPLFERPILLGRQSYDAPAAAAASSGVNFRLVITSSTTPYSTASSAVRM